MINLDKEYKALCNHLNRYKGKPLAFECGCACGIVTDVEMVEREDGVPRHIDVIGKAGFDNNDRVIMSVFESMSKGKDYKYWKQYHVLERFY